MNLTRHAQVRRQQRGIPQIVIDLLLDYGSAERSGKNACSYYFDKAARRQVLAYVGPIGRAIEEYLDCYAVVGDDGRVITVAPRIKRIRH